MLLKRAVDISVDLLCRAACFVVDDQKYCHVEVGTLGECDQCIKRFIMQKALQELKEIIPEIGEEDEAP